MILHYKNIDVKSDTISFKKRVQYSDNFSFIPIKFLNNDLIIQTPYLFVPFNISNYDQKTDKKHIVLSFFEDDKNNNIFIEKLNDIIKIVQNKYSDKILNNFIKENNYSKWMRLKVQDNCLFFNDQKEIIDGCSDLGHMQGGSDAPDTFHSAKGGQDCLGHMYTPGGNK